MRTTYTLLGIMLLALGFLGLGCKTAGSTAGKVDKSQNDAQQELIDVLRATPGLYVQGSRQDPMITIRGAKTITGDNRPLFAIDGTPVGRDYSSVASSVNARDVASVQVISGAAAASRFGARATNGVILIKLKE